MRNITNTCVPSWPLPIWCAAAVLILATADASADNLVTPSPQDASTLAEVVVTAQRREERLQDVPISVTAFSRQTMDAQGLRNIDDLTRLTPGVTFQRNGVASSSNYNDEFSDISIRGIDSTAGASTTGVYIDDTPIQGRHLGYGAVNAFPTLFDLDRVEVLRGPQGTLFGAGAEGGVVRFITPQPNVTHDSGYLSTEVASTRDGNASYEAGAALGGVIIDDTLGFRVSASFRHDGGWVDRVTYTLAPNPESPSLPIPAFSGIVEPNSNWQETETLRAALKWVVNDRLSVTPSIYYQQLHVNDTASYWANLSNVGAGNFYNGNTLANSSHDPFALGAIRVDWDLGFARLTSNTSYFWRNLSSISNTGNYLQAIYAAAGLLPTIYPPSGATAWAPFGDQQKNVYQEIRLASRDSDARVQWSTGAFYSRLHENVPEYVYAPQLERQILTYTTAQGAPYDLCAPPLTCPNGQIEYNPIDKIVDKQAAIFGEASVGLGAGFKATLGLRVSHVEYSGAAQEGGPFVGAVIAQSGGASETPVTPKFVFSYEADRDHLYYTSMAKGYRVGGTNTPVASLCASSLAALGLPNGQSPPTYRSDSLWSYEVGAKNLLMDRRLQINGSLFLIDWNNIQQSVYLPSCGFAYTANTGKVQSRGGDVDLQFRPVDSLTIGLTAAYTDARFTESACPGALQFSGAGAGCTGPTAPVGGVAPVVSDGDRLTGAPWTITASAEEHFRDWNGHTPYLRIDYQFSTAQHALPPYHDSRNSSYDATLPGLPQTRNLQLRAGCRWNGYDISLFAQNVLNQNPALFVSRDVASPPNSDNLYFARGQRPLTIGLTATYHYY
jgi:iron complex outermembrane receptor protein